MIIGFASGAYSSICVATSLWVLWKIEIRMTFAINNLIVIVKALNPNRIYCDWGFSYE